MRLTSRIVAAVAALAAVIVAVVFYQYVTLDEFIREPSSKYDYIIVGAGTSGCVLASKLSANPLNKVLLIEAGGDAPWYSWIPLVAPFLQGSRHDWQFRTVPQTMAAGALHHRESFWPQGKMIGGTGQMNFLIHTIGSPSDYDSWRVDGWDSHSLKSTFDRLSCWLDRDEPPQATRSFLPDEMCTADFLRHEEENATDCGGANKEVEPVFRQCPTASIKVNRINETESDLVKAFLEAGRQLDYSSKNLNRWKQGQSETAFMASSNTIHQGRRWSTYLSYLKPAMKRKNLHVLPHSSVTKIIWSKNKAVGVRYIDSSGREKRVAADKEVLLSAGTVKTTQILQLSGVGPAHVLEPLNIPVLSDLPVGENLQDHLQLPLFVELLNSTVSMNMAKMLRPSQLWNYMSNRKGAFATSGVEGIATLKLANSSTPGGMIILFNMGSINADIYTSVANIKKDVFYKWFPKTGNFSQEGFVLISVCLHPKSRGRIRIRSTDPSRQPEIDPNYLSHPHDASCLIETMRQGLQLISTAPFRELGARVHLPTFPECGKPDVDDDDYMQCVVRMAAITMYHPIGTCAMGDDKHTESVVDSQLKVRGMKGIRVVDASVIPHLTSGPPNSILVGVAEQASHLINIEQ